MDIKTFSRCFLYWCFSCVMCGIVSGVFHLPFLLLPLLFCAIGLGVTLFRSRPLSPIGSMGALAACFVFVIAYLQENCLIASAIGAAAVLFMTRHAPEQSAESVLAHFWKCFLVYVLIDTVASWSPLGSHLLTFVSYRLTELCRNYHGGGEILGPGPLDLTWFLFGLILSVPARAGFRVKLAALLLALPLQASAILMRLWLDTNLSIAWSATSALFIYGVLCRRGTAPQTTAAIRTTYALNAAAAAAVSAALLCQLAGWAVLFRDDRPNGQMTVLFIDDSPAGKATDNDMSGFVTFAHDANPYNINRQNETPNYGLLTSRFLPAWGYAVSIKKPSELTADSIREPKIVVALCLQNELDATLMRALYEGVSSGEQSLLALGDHTDIHGVMFPTNQLLKPTGIRVLYDSAYPQGSGWKRNVSFAPHGINRQLIGPAIFDPRVSVGASLEVPWTSWPVLVGDRGFSDRGTPNAPQFAGLGDMQYNPGEKFGGIILAAEQRLGRGKVLAFGDTAFLQSPSLSSNSAYVKAVFDYLVTPSHRFEIPFLYNLAAVALVCFLLCSVFGQLSGRLYVSATILVAAVGIWPFVVGQPDPRAGIDGPTVVVHTGHGSAWTPHSRSDSASTLSLLFSISGYTAFDLDAIQQIRSSNPPSAVVFINPRIRFSPRETESLIRYAESGGIILYASDYYNAVGNSAFFERIGATVTKMPLGGGFGGLSHSGLIGNGPLPAMQEMWALEITGPWTPVLLAYDKPVIACRRLGKGGVLLVGDKSAILDAELGTETHIAPFGFVYWRTLLDYVFLGTAAGEATT